MLSLFQYCIISALSWAFWLCIRRFIFKSPLDNIPGPPSQSFITGNLPQVYDLNGWKFHEQMSKTYGSVVKFHGLFGDRMLYVSDPKALYHVVVKDHHVYEPTSAFIESNRILLGMGLLSTIGDVHHRQRKMFNTVFSVPHMRRMVPTFHEISKKLRNAIASQVEHGPREVDMFHWTTRIGLELIGQAGLGYSFDPLTEKSSNPYTMALMDFAPLVFSFSILALFIPYVTKLGPARFRRWLMDTIKWSRLHRLRDIVDEMDRSSNQILQEKKAALRQGDEAMMEQVGRGRDIMSVLLRTNMAASEEDQLPEAEVLGQMGTLVATGMDTSANAIARLLDVLSKHPEAQEKLRQELWDACDNKDDGELTYDELTSLPYLDAICRETLRLYAPVSMFARTARKDMVLPLSKPIIGVDGSKIQEIPVPADTNVVIAIRASNIDPELWGNDVMEWKPERWFSPLPETLTNANVPGVYANTMTFLGGPRSCVGYKFSQMEIKCVLSHLLRSFRFSPSGREITWNMAVIAFPTIEGSPRGKLPLKVELLESRA